MDGVDVKVNFAQIDSVVSGIKNSAAEVKTLCNELYALMDDNIGAENKGTGAWYGNNASKFMNQAAEQKVVFDTSYDNLINIADNLQNQVDQWRNFEGM
mgnify:CR=1 FL=1